MDKKMVDASVKAAEVLEYKGMKAIVPTMMGKGQPKSEEEAETMNNEMVATTVNIFADLTKDMTEQEVRDMLNVRLMNGTIGLMNSMTMSIVQAFKVTDMPTIMDNLHRILQGSDESIANSMSAYFQQKGMEGPCDCVNCDIDVCPTRKEDYVPKEEQAADAAPDKAEPSEDPNVIGKIKPADEGKEEEK